MTQALRGQVAIVTGGASGMGLAHARLLGRRGARVAVTDRNDGTLAAAGRTARSRANQSKPFQHGAAALKGRRHVRMPIMGARPRGRSCRYTTSCGRPAISPEFEAHPLDASIEILPDGGPSPDGGEPDGGGGDDAGDDAGTDGGLNDAGTPVQPVAGRSVTWSYCRPKAVMSCGWSFGLT